MTKKPLDPLPEHAKARLQDVCTSINSCICPVCGDRFNHCEGGHKCDGCDLVITDDEHHDLEMNSRAQPKETLSVFDEWRRSRKKQGAEAEETSEFSRHAKDMRILQCRCEPTKDLSPEQRDLVKEKLRNSKATIQPVPDPLSARDGEGAFERDLGRNLHMLSKVANDGVLLSHRDGVWRVWLVTNDGPRQLSQSQILREALECAYDATKVQPSL